MPLLGKIDLDWKFKMDLIPKEKYLASRNNFQLLLSTLTGDRPLQSTAKKPSEILAQVRSSQEASLTLK